MTINYTDSPMILCFKPLIVFILAEPFKAFDEQKTILVENLPVDATKKELAEFFSQFGKIKVVRLRNYQGKKISKRTDVLNDPFLKSYIIYYEVRSQKLAIRTCCLGTHKLRGRQMTVTKVVHRMNISQKTIYVGNLPSDTTEEDLRMHFKDCGVITAVQLTRGEDELIGYVAFNYQRAVDRALSLPTGRIRGRNIQVLTYKRHLENTKRPAAKQSTKDSSPKKWKQENMKEEILRRNPVFGVETYNSINVPNLQNSNGFCPPTMNYGADTCPEIAYVSHPPAISNGPYPPVMNYGHHPPALHYAPIPTSQMMFNPRPLINNHLPHPSATCSQPLPPGVDMIEYWNNFLHKKDSHTAKKKAKEINNLIEILKN